MSNLPSVLIVEDNAEARTMLGELLVALGAEPVREVASAEEAIEILSRERFSLIISDYRLEGMDGVQFLERIRQSGDGTPVLLLSGAPEPQALLRASRHPKVDMFAKPFGIAQLSGAMQRLLAA